MKVPAHRGLGTRGPAHGPAVLRQFMQIRIRAMTSADGNRNQEETGCGRDGGRPAGRGRVSIELYCAACLFLKGGSTPPGHPRPWEGRAPLVVCGITARNRSAQPPLVYRYLLTPLPVCTASRVSGSHAPRSRLKCVRSISSSCSTLVISVVSCTAPAIARRTNLLFSM
jgi:hypothetical protein